MITKEEIIVLYQKHEKRIKKIAKIIGAIVAICFFILVVFILSVRFGAFGKLPSISEIKKIKNHVASEVYSEDGVLMGKYFIENRTNVSLDAISPHVIDALIATEDARFYQHNGIDYRSLFRVFFKTILGGNRSAGGGSTISQQLAKNLYGRKNSMPVNKVKEMFIAKRLEKIYSKKEILTLYLNTVSFGEDVFGIEVAAERFFNKTPDQLKIEEAAILVGMLKAPTYYNPHNHPERAEERRNVVFQQMVNYNKLKKENLDSLQNLKLEINYYLLTHNVGLAPYFREHLKKELKEWCKQHLKSDGTPYNLFTDGLKIHTTINSKMQTYAEIAVKKHLANLQKAFDNHWKNSKPWGDDKIIEKAKKKTKRYKALKKAGFTEKEISNNFNQKIEMTIFDWKKGEVQKKVSPLDSLKFYYALLNTGFLAMDPINGKIKAWVGGTNFKYFKYDHVKSKRQVGSTFKPIVYATALQEGYQACDYFYNRQVIYSEYDDWAPKNSDGKYGGMLSMEGGLTHSVNSITVDIIMKTGMKKVIELAQKMGIKSTIPEVPSIALGTADISLFEMIQVYGTLANQGIKTSPKYLLKIEDAHGNIIGDFIPKLDEIEQDTSHVLSKDEARIITKMLESVVDSGTAKRLRWKYNLHTNIAGKTGTTQSQADGWFMGYTPHVVAGAWVGAEDPKVHFRDISLGQGANMALPIWAEFMKQVYQDKEFKWMQNDTFPHLTFEQELALQCAHKISEEEYELLKYQAQNNIDIQVNGQSIQDIFETIIKNKNINKNPAEEERKRKQREQKELEKIKRELERQKKREERRKKRKKFFKDLFK